MNDMNFLDLVKARYSVRSYRPQAVEREKVEYLLECARLAPSAVNFQPWRFFVVASDACREDAEETQVAGRGRRMALRRKRIPKRTFYREIR